MCVSVCVIAGPEEGESHLGQERRLNLINLNQPHKTSKHKHVNKQWETETKRENRRREGQPKMKKKPKKQS